jgi:hypothetical protein
MSDGFSPCFSIGENSLRNFAIAIARIRTIEAQFLLNEHRDPAAPIPFYR